VVTLGDVTGYGWLKEQVPVSVLTTSKLTWLTGLNEMEREGEVYSARHSHCIRGSALLKIS